MNGWVCLHRKFLNWEWYNDANCVRVFLHLLLKANHKDNTLDGIKILRGQLITSSDSLSSDLNLTRNQIRHTLKKLDKTKEITIQGNNKYSLITISNYNEYQKKNDQNDKKQQKNELIIPSWIDIDLWSEWLEIRNELKCSNTNKALKTQINKLIKIESENGRGNQALEKSKDKRWKAIYPIKNKEFINAKSKTSGKNSKEWAESGSLVERVIRNKAEQSAVECNTVNC